MKSLHEKENVREADTFERGQRDASPRDEKGASDKNLEDVPQVGPTHGPKAGRRTPAFCSTSGVRSRWFEDQTWEIGASPPNAGECRICDRVRRNNWRPIHHRCHSHVPHSNHIERSESKFEGSWRKAVLFWRTKRWKKLLKV